MTQVDQFMTDLSNGAAEIVMASSNQTVVANSTGLHIGGDSNYQMRATDRMIAMTDDGWKTAKVGLGLFAHEGVNNGNPIWGINTELIAGNLMIGNSCVLQNPLVDENGHVTGTMMFRVDGTGAWLYNSRIVLQSPNGLIAVDPDYGIVAGTKLLFDTNGTTVTPEFMDKAGEITFDSDGMPKNANFYLDINTGNAYFRGKLQATSGKIGGYTIEESYLHAGSGGTYVGLNGGLTVYPDYAIWAGASNPSNAPFWVKKDGTMSAKNGLFTGGTFKDITATGGTFSNMTAKSGTFENITVSGNSTFNGTLNAPNLKGVMTADASGGWIEGCGIRVGKNSSASKGYNFYVDSSGNVTINGGSISWDKKSFPVQSQFSMYNYTDDYYWHDTMKSTDKYRRDKQYDGSWGSPYQFRGEDGKSGQNGVVDYSEVNKILKDTYGITYTNISGTEVSSPTIRGGRIYGCEFYGNEFNIISEDDESGEMSMFTKYGKVFTIRYEDMGGFGPAVVLEGNGGTLTFNGWSHIIGLKATATFG